MMQKVLLMLCSSALISAGVIRTDYAPAGSISYSSTPVVEKTFNTPNGYTKIIQSQPVYQSVLITKESNNRSPDGTQHIGYTKSLDTAYSNLKKYETKSKDGDVVANTIPVSYSTPVFDQTKYVTSGLSSYSSHTPVIESQPVKTTITYSQAPLVSHMSFTGLGASYAW
ncbi:hypothetical protein PYW08_003301 [Mythimna loreyi]|uniref:Uncharacterized protein n=1 Tax=Mythimna loreyi TaxID=667449 RepID=A0ACC2QSR5_9NEOP|nr:hypothetical protein PYW08_003301 [Mythimna loreyi]